MSDQSSLDITLTNIEKKVIKNTLLTNSNCLKNKERSKSQISLFSNQSKNLSSIYHEEFSNISSSSIFTNIQQKSKPAESLNETVFNLQELVNKTSPRGILLLKSGDYLIESLTISQSINIKGTTGSKFIVKEKINIKAYEKYVRVLFSEIKFEFHSESGISIDPQLVEIEISDSLVTCKDSICSKFIQMNISETNEPLSSSSRITISSCDISGFSEIVNAGKGCDVIVNKSQLMNCHGSALVLNSPNSARIYMCHITKCKKNGIEIMYSEESLNPSTSSKNEKSKNEKSPVVEKEIYIEENIIIYNNGSGLSIYSETFYEFPGNILIKNNKICKNKKEGLSIRHLAINSIICSENDITYNELSCCWIQKLQQLSNDSAFYFSANKFSDSLLGYGIYMYSCSIALHNNSIFKNALGGVFITGKSSSSSYEAKKPISLDDCLIYSNGGNGIEISDFSNSVQIDYCKVIENTKSGLCCMRNNLTEKKKNFVESKNSEYSSNTEYGIIIVKSKCIFSSLSIFRNSMGEILIGENTLDMVKLDDRFLNNKKRVTSIKAQKNCKGACIIY